MNILVTNNHLKTYGGSETFTYALIEELCRLGHHLEYFTFEKGLTSNKIEQNLNVHFFSRKKYNKESGYFLRQFSLENLNIKIQVEKYLQINEEYKGSPELQKKILISNFQSNIMFYLSLPHKIFNINKWCKRYASKKVNKIEITKQKLQINSIKLNLFQ